MTANVRKANENTAGQTILNRFQNLNAFETIYFCIYYIVLALEFKPNSL